MDINGIMKNKIPKKSTIRDIMQILGTDLLRQGFNNNIHVAATLGSIKENEKVIITDTRFPNEAQAIKDKGGIIIRVERPNLLNNQNNINLEHISETALDAYEFSHSIENNGTIEELIKQVKKILIKEKIL